MEPVIRVLVLCRLQGMAGVPAVDHEHDRDLARGLVRQRGGGQGRRQRIQHRRQIHIRIPSTRVVSHWCVSASSAILVPLSSVVPLTGPPARPVLETICCAGIGYLPMLPTFRQLLPGINPVALVASVVFFVPLIRDFCSWAGFRQASPCMTTVCRPAMWLFVHSHSCRLYRCMTVVALHRPQSALTRRCRRRRSRRSHSSEP